MFFFRACVETKCWWLCFELGPSKCHMNPSKFPHLPGLKWFTIFIYYGHLLVTSGYKWDYTSYKWCFVGTYNWHNSGHNCTRSCAQSPQKKKNGTGGNINFHCWIHRHHPAQIPSRILNSPTWLVDGWPTPLKNDGVRQLGWRTSQLNGRIKIIFQTTNQMSVTMNRSNTKPGLLEPTLGRLPDPTCRVATAVAPVMFQSCNLRIIAALWLGHPLHGVSNLIHIDAMRHPCTFKPGLLLP